MTSEQLSATTTIPAAPDEVFAVLADPTGHAAINGSVGGTSANKTGWVTGPVDGERLTGAGQVFRMGMSHPKGHYQTANQVRDFDPPHSISWATGTEDDKGKLSFGGWTWRYDLTPAGDGATKVRLTYDWSAATPEARQIIGFPPFGVDHLQSSLLRLAELVTS
jgi:uncharacterized protein YndB with AHSA1/START domain